MPTITLGRSGNQWFDITQDGVSQHHAKLTIPTDPNEPWILEDNHSTNGTFIRDENGRMVRISRVEISPMTFIQLGPSDITGCSFYATKCEVNRQERPDKYRKEFEFIRQELRQYQTVCQKEKKIKKWRRLTNRYSWWIVIPILVVCDEVLAKHPDFMSKTELLRFFRIVLRYIPAILIAAWAWYINKKSKLSLAKQRWDATRRCPNPKCIHELSPEEVIAGLCEGKQCDGENCRAQK